MGILTIDPPHRVVTDPGQQQQQQQQGGRESPGAADPPKPQALDATMCNELAETIAHALETLLDRKEKGEARQQEEHAKNVVNELSGQVKTWSERQDKVHAAAMAREVLSSLTAALWATTWATRATCASPSLRSSLDCSMPSAPSST